MARRRTTAYPQPTMRTSADLRDVQREVQLLTNQLENEQANLRTWQRRLDLRTAYEATHAGPKQLPALRQECAACHARVLDLARRLDQARVRLRALSYQRGI